MFWLGVAGGAGGRCVNGKRAAEEGLVSSGGGCILVRSPSDADGANFGRG